MTVKQIERGGVSIFVVIFSALFVTIITVSFVGIMLKNQMQSTNADLSASAYDSALAGVEDAKRLMLTYKDCQARADSTPGKCANAIAAMATAVTNCGTINKGLDGLDVNSERFVQRSDSASPNDLALDQAYTCVKIRYTTNNIEKTGKDDETDMIPLETANPYDSVRISWFKKPSGSVNVLGVYKDPMNPAKPSLPKKADWKGAASNQDVPPVLRAQFIQVGDSFTLDSFDSGDDLNSNTNTVLLYPFAIATASPPISIASADFRSATPGTKAPQPVNCNSSNYAAGGYACSTILTLPNPASGTRKSAYLRIGAIYKDADYKIELLNGTSVVGIIGVQPEVDSTGRANDLFRRVSARVEFTNSFDYPKATIETKGDLCKTFGLTDIDSDFTVGACTP